MFLLVIVMNKKMFTYWAKSTSDISSYHLLPYHSLDVAAVGYTYLRHDDLLCRRIAGLNGISQERLLDLIAFLLSLHDLGKFSEAFQGKIPPLFLSLRGREPKPKAELRHDTLGMILWEENLKQFVFREKIFPEEEERVLRKIDNALSPLFCAILGHHGRPPKTEDFDDFFVSDDVLCSREFVSSLLELFPIDRIMVNSLAQPDIQENIRALSWPFAGFTVFSDWIASNERLFPYHSERVPLDIYWSEVALPQADHALKYFNILPFTISQNRGIAHLFPNFKGGQYTPSPLQEYASQVQPGPGPHFYIIEESTGSGKTEAALTLAHQLMAGGNGHGLYFALPTMATSNAMWERIRAIKENFFAPGRAPSPVILAHSAREIGPLFLAANISRSDDDSRNMEGNNDLSLWLEDNRKKALLAALGVGTIDQALIAVLPRRYQSLRLFGLWRNVLIVDEVHAYDPYVNELLKNLICIHARIGGSSILLSATLPVITRNEFIKAFCEGAHLEYQEGRPITYPLVTHISPSGAEEIMIPPRPGTEREIDLEFFMREEDVISALLSAGRSGKCACWIRNTVRDAREAYHQLKSNTCNLSKFLLFHARYVLGDRLEKEREVIMRFGKDSKPEDRNGWILIATQVVEQSLDLDFDSMVTDLAPIDLVIQRSGRLHRHPRGNRGRPLLGIHAPAWAEEPGEDWYSGKFQGAAWVYPSHGEIWLTLQVLREKGRIRLPENARDLVEWVYGKDAVERIPPSLTARDNRFSDDHERRGIAMTNVINFPAGYQVTDTIWPDDDDVPTRLAEPSVTLRLGTFDERQKTIQPIFSAGENSWEMSQVSVPRAQTGGIRYVKEMEQLAESAKKTMRDRGKYTVLIPLVQLSENRWENSFPRDDGKKIRISYSKEEGLSIDEL